MGPLLGSSGRVTISWFRCSVPGYSFCLPLQSHVYYIQSLLSARSGTNLKPVRLAGIPPQLWQYDGTAGTTDFPRRSVIDALAE